MKFRNPASSKIFVILAYRRTGSNYLMKVLDSFANVDFFGEVYHQKTVWIPTAKKRKYVEWLDNTHNQKVNIGYKAFEDSELVKLNHDRPDYFLDFLALTSDRPYVGFKIFPEHLTWQQLSTILLDRHICKLVLKRNLLNVYISDKILDRTNSSQTKDTSKIKINIDCLNFRTWYFETQSYYSRLELCLRNHNQKYSEIFYEQIHSYSCDEEKSAFIQQWLQQNNIQIEGRSIAVNYPKRQDKRTKILAKIEIAKN